MTDIGSLLRDGRTSKWLFVFTSVLFAVILAFLYGYVYLNLDPLDGGSLVTAARCPDCNGLITMWDQTASPQPDSVDCPECGGRIQEKVEYFGVLEAAAITSFALLTLTVIAAFAAGAWRRLWCSLIVFILYFALLELGTNLLLFNYAELSMG